ncbi:CASP6 [Branchiostoma lanceolatum]|uniref:Caspase-6 n=1 Tax=Branchiostoma lanceolatum TaxID=7740 RepID=A0A8K0A6K9_BRALA|nr:CASP6 [Branchiostoma lanceolatum]
MSEEEPVNKRHKGDGDSALAGAVEGMLRGPVIRMDRERRQEAPRVGPDRVPPGGGNSALAAAVEGMLRGPNVEMEEQRRVEAPVVGPVGPGHTEKVVTDSMQEGQDVPDAPIYSIAVRRAPPQVELVQDLPSYSMNHRQRGLCLVFDNEEFHWTTKMNRRRGSHVDAANLQMLFEGLGFSVEVLKDKEITEIRQILFSAAMKYDHSQADCFVCVFLSHGEDGMIYGYNGTVPIKELTDMFRADRCTTLNGKPKLFFIQACRGAKHEIPVEPLDEPDGLEGSGEAEPMDVVDSGVRPTLPAGADFLMAYSVSEGFYSHRDTVNGSWYVQDLCAALKQHGTNMEIHEILALVNRMVSCREVERTTDQKSLGMKQMPCFLSMLTKRLIFTPKN